jgi:hypothetical protein
MVGFNETPHLDLADLKFDGNVSLRFFQNGVFFNIFFFFSKFKFGIFQSFSEREESKTGGMK